MRKQAQPSRASQLKGMIASAGSRFSPGSAKSGSSTAKKPGLMLLAGAGAGAAALAARKRFSAGSEEEPARADLEDQIEAPEREEAQVEEPELRETTTEEGR